MAQIERVHPENFDWLAEHGPAAEVRRIARASTAHDGASTLNEQALLQLKNRGLQGAALWLGDGGFALRYGEASLDLAVHPESRRRGVGTTLARAALSAGQAPGLPEGRQVDAWSHADHPGAARLAERFGVPRERELKIMRRDASLPLPATALPEGVRVRTFEDSDAEALLKVNASAFAHHPEQGEMSLANLRERTSESWFDPHGLFLAVPDAPEPGDPALLGFHWTKVHRDEEPAYGEVYVVAVNPKAAGRGLGSALTNVGLQHLHDQGLGSVLLYVDGDNDPAIAVYTRQGFEVERTEVQYRGVPARLA